MFIDKGWKIVGIIDSDESKHNQLVRNLQVVQLEKEDGMIVALGRRWGARGILTVERTIRGATVGVVQYLVVFQMHKASNYAV